MADILCISEGNRKLGTIPSISFPATTEGGCPPNAPCRAKCYARKPYAKSSQKAYRRNLEAYEKGEYWSRLSGWMQWKTPRFFRFNVSGDVLSEKYVAEMIEFCREHGGVKFLVFSKRYELFADIHPLDLPENLSVVLSAWPGWATPREVGAGHYPVAWIETDPRAPEGAIPCQGHCDTCGVCWGLARRGIDVVLPLH